MIPIGAWAAGCGPLRLLRSRKFIIQYSKFRITKSGCSLRRTRTKRTFGDANCGPPPGEAAARRCLRHRIRLKRAHSRTDGLATLEEQPSAGGGRLRAAAVPFRNCKFRIQNSGFKIRWAAGYAWAYLPVRAAGCGEHARSGLAERELRASARGKGCDLPIAARLILWNTSPQPSGWACTSGPSGREMQPSAGGGRLRAAAVPSGTANS